MDAIESLKKIGYSEEEIDAYCEWGWFENDKYGERSPACEYLDCSEPSCFGALSKECKPDFCPYLTCPVAAARLIHDFGRYNKSN